MIYLLFYDISSNAIRTRIAKLLMAEGFERLQFSVYSSTINPLKNRTLWNSLESLLSYEPEAKLYVLPITKKNFYEIKTIGIFGFDLDYLAGEKRSLII